MNRLNSSAWLLLLTLTLAAGWSCANDADKLARVPEGKLAPAGAELVTEDRYKNGLGIGGPASVRRVYRWDGHDFDDVRAFYAEELLARGWQPSVRDRQAIWTSEKHRISIAETTLEGTLFGVSIMEAKDER